MADPSKPEMLLMFVEELIEPSRPNAPPKEHSFSLLLRADSADDMNAWADKIQGIRP